MLEKDFPDTSTFEQINAVPFDEESELTEIEVEEMFGKVRALKNLIAEAQNRRDNFQTLYRQKIARAEEIFQTDTQYYSAELDAVTKRLRRFAEKNITGKKRSMKFPSGTLSFTKQTPQFFIGGQAVTNDNPKLIELARSLD
ncbi:MAG: host-nuclease inhibitor Gam family protein, partial [Selenomonadaceae bacterium]|nr:host-nuclease inhibitor Gam family protein [Selenomonadaceae bacterium]